MEACGQILYEGGKPFARCAAERYTEHDHDWVITAGLIEKLHPAQIRDLAGEHDE